MRRQKKLVCPFIYVLKALIEGKMRASRFFNLYVLHIIKQRKIVLNKV